jgi:hypothetical protein
LGDLNYSTLERVCAIVSDISGLPPMKLSKHLAVDQDLKISGSDVEDLAEALANEFGEQVWQWPWQRFALRGEGLLNWAPFWLAWRLLTWPIRVRVFDPSPVERLELGHIAAVIHRGEWFDPEVTSE